MVEVDECFGLVKQSVRLDVKLNASGELEVEGFVRLDASHCAQVGHHGSKDKRRAFVAKKCNGRMAEVVHPVVYLARGACSRYECLP